MLLSEFVERIDSVVIMRNETKPLSHLPATYNAICDNAGQCDFAWTNISRRALEKQRETIVEHGELCN